MSDPTTSTGPDQDPETTKRDRLIDATLDQLTQPDTDQAGRVHLLRELHAEGWCAGVVKAAEAFFDGPASRAFRLGRDVERRGQQRRQEATDQAAELPSVEHCPGCGAQLPENAGCQNPGCDGNAASGGTTSGPVACDQPAATVVEAHSAEGMEQEHFVCTYHITAAVAGIREAGLRPRLTGAVVRLGWNARCGDADLYDAAGGER